MQLPIDFGTPLFNPFCNIWTLAENLVKDLKRFYLAENKFIKHEHARANTKYNEVVVN